MMKICNMTTFETVAFIILAALVSIGCGRLPIRHQGNERRNNNNNQQRGGDHLMPATAASRNKRDKLLHFDEAETSGNLTLIEGEDAFLQCVVRNVGNKSVSWLRHLEPIPQLLALNNLTNTYDERITAFHKPGSEVYVLRIKRTFLNDTGFYECQVAGKGKISLYRLIHLNIVAPITTILGGGHDLYVDRGSTLNVTCAVDSGEKKPEFIYWSKNDRIVSFAGTEFSESPKLLMDKSGRFLSRLIIRRIDHGHAGVYACQPASAEPAYVTVHVLNGTVLAVANVEESEGSSSSEASSESLASSKSFHSNLEVGILLGPIFLTLRR